jgi:hypothetical protein
MASGRPGTGIRRRGEQAEEEVWRRASSMASGATRQQVLWGREGAVSGSCGAD